MVRTGSGFSSLRLVRVAVLAVVGLVLATKLWAEPVFRLGTASGSAGATTLLVPLEIEAFVGEGSVAGWSAVVSYDPTVLTAVRVESLRRSDVFGYRTHARHGMPGVLVIWTVYSLGDDATRMIPEGSFDAVANIEFCVLETASTGTYGVTFLTQSPQDHRYYTAATSYLGTYETKIPVLEAGAVSINGDAVPGSACVSEVPEPPPPPPFVQGTFELQDTSAVRGLPVEIPFSINAEEKVLGFSFSIDFDEEVLETYKVDALYSQHFASGGDPASEYVHFEVDDRSETPGNAGVDEGFITGAVVFDLISNHYFLPPNSQNEVLNLIFLVKPDAPLGTTEVRFLDGGSFLSITQKNAFIAAGATVYPDSIPASVLVNARISIIGDVSPFRVKFTRGDVNVDKRVDIADAVRSFMFLFLGAEPPLCLDAADATDDGVIDISDGVRILSFIFGPGGFIPHPGTRSCGFDFQEDDLACESYPFCVDR